MRMTIGEIIGLAIGAFLFGVCRELARRAIRARREKRLIGLLAFLKLSRRP